MNKKLFNHTGEQFLIKEGTIEIIKEIYNTQPVYLTHDKKKSDTDITPRVWYLIDTCNAENKFRTWKYTAGIGESDFPVYEKVAYSLGYLYDEERLKWIQKITGYKKVRPEDVF